MSLQTKEKKITFCEKLFYKACNEAKKRIGSQPKPKQLQIIDLRNAFNSLKHEKFSAQFGHISTEWNEVITIIEEFTSVNKQKTPPNLPSEIGEAIGNAILAWHQFDKLPQETKEFIQKAHSSFLSVKENILHNINHFFNEIRVRTTHIATSEQERVMALLSLHEPQCKNAGKKGVISEVHNYLDKCVQKMNRVLQKEKPSRKLQIFLTKMRHDLEHFKTVNI